MVGIIFTGTIMVTLTLQNNKHILRYFLEHYSSKLFIGKNFINHMTNPCLVIGPAILSTLTTCLLMLLACIHYMTSS